MMMMMVSQLICTTYILLRKNIIITNIYILYMNTYEMKEKLIEMISSLELMCICDFYYFLFIWQCTHSNWLVW